MVRVKYFGRHKGGAIRDGVLVAIIHQPQTRLAPAWSCDTDAVIAEMDAADGVLLNARWRFSRVCLIH